jgi:hypothetical protein
MEKTGYPFRNVRVGFLNMGDMNGVKDPLVQRAFMLSARVQFGGVTRANVKVWAEVFKLSGQPVTCLDGLALPRFTHSAGLYGTIR